MTKLGLKAFRNLSPGLLVLFPRADVTKNHKRGGLSNASASSFCSGSYKSEIQMWAQPRSFWGPEGSSVPAPSGPQCLLVTSVSLPCWCIPPALMSSPHARCLRYLCLLSLLLPGHQPVGLGIHCTYSGVASSYLITSANNPLSRVGPMLGAWRLGLEDTLLGKQLNPYHLLQCWNRCLQACCGAEMKK